MPRPTGHNLGGRTWTEVDAGLEAGERTVIIAIGSIEQHGPHLPLRTDALIGDELAARIADRLDGATVAPTIRPGCSGHHMGFPGTITVSPETLMATIRSYCTSLEEHGFDHVILVPTHGGNFAPTNTVVPEIAREIDATVIALADLEEYMELLNDGLHEAGIDYREPVVHAGATETAMVLAIERALVSTDQYERGYEGAVSAAQMLSRGFASVTENGVLGDPHQASEAAGEQILETVAREYAARIETELNDA